MRRRAAFGMLRFACGLSLAAAGRAADGPLHFALTPAGQGVYAAIAKPGDPSSLGNAGFVVGSDGVLVVDSFATEEAAGELLAEIHRITPLPVRFLVDTHYHRDHVGGNAVFAKVGAVIVAHENVRAWERSVDVPSRKEITAADREALSALRLPDVTYRDGITIWLGERRVDVLTHPGHTGGDSIVSVPDAGVVFGGDLVWKNTIPNLIDAKTDAWIETLDGLIRAFPKSVFVPGHGGLARPLDVRFFRDYLVGLRLVAARGIQGGNSGAALVEVVLPQLRARYGTWAWFEFADANIRQTEAELKGTKAFPVPPHP